MLEDGEEVAAVRIARRVDRLTGAARPHVQDLRAEQEDCPERRRRGR